MNVRRVLVMLSRFKIMRSQFTVPGYTAIDSQEHWVKKLLHEANNGNNNGNNGNRELALWI